MKIWTKEELEGKKPDEMLKLIMEAYGDLAKNLGECQKSEDFKTASAEIQAKHDEMKTALETLEKTVKENQKAHEKEVTILKQGTGWQSEQKADKAAKVNDLYNKCIRFGFEGLDADDKKAFADTLQVKGMATGGSGGGGFLVIEERSSAIDLIIKEFSTLREFARVQSGSSDAWVEPTQTGRTEARYIGELTPPKESKAPTFGQFKIEANKIESEPRVTQEQLDDSDYDVMGFLDSDVAEEIAILEGNRHFLGTDPNTPEGILTRPNGTGAGEIVQKTSAQTGKIVLNDLITMNVSLKKPYRANARWLANKETIGDIRAIVDLEGRPIMTPDITRGGLPNVFERPLEEAFDMEENISGKLSLLFADIQKLYMIYDRTGRTVFRDPYTARPEIIFVHTLRSGGKVKKGEAGTLLKIKA